MTIEQLREWLKDRELSVRRIVVDGAGLVNLIEAHSPKLYQWTIHFDPATGDTTQWNVYPINMEVPHYAQWQ